jgi:hypothetical protein
MVKLKSRDGWTDFRAPGRVVAHAVRAYTRDRPMNLPNTPRPLLNEEFDRLLEVLTTRQHLRPHEPIEQSLTHTVELMDVCPNAIAQALGWLQIDTSTLIGRLRRTELTQLARSIHRFWRQAAPTPQPQ